MSNYDGKIEPLPTYYNQGNERYLSSDKPDTYLWLAEENTKQAKQIERLRKQLKEANDLLKGLYDDSPCQFDHNGYCQEHGSTDGNYICVQGELKEYLERYGVK